MPPSPPAETGPVDGRMLGQSRIRARSRQMCSNSWWAFSVDRSARENRTNVSRSSRAPSTRTIMAQSTEKRCGFPAGSLDNGLRTATAAIRGRAYCCLRSEHTERHIWPLRRDRHRVICPSVQLSPGAFFLNSSPLLEEERHLRLLALPANVVDRSEERRV